jgi:hypothetical protein
VTDFRTASIIGARIAALRGKRGVKSAKELGDAVPNDSITDAIIQNIEARRKTDLAVSQLRNLAWALKVPPIFLLAAIVRPDEPLDLPNLTEDVTAMGAAELDVWIAGLTDGKYNAMNADERHERNLLDAYRNLLRERRERRKLTVVLQLEADAGFTSTAEGDERKSSGGTLKVALLKRSAA